MKCYYHSEIDAVATCDSCGKAICQECAVEVAGRVRCQECLSKTSSRQTLKPTTRPTNPLAITSLAIAVLGLLGCVCGGGIGGVIFGIPATIIGWFARKQIGESQQEQQGEQLATIGMVLGIGEIVLSLLVLILWGGAMGLAFLSEMGQYGY
jgi:hypothetical protein